MATLESFEGTMRAFRFSRRTGGRRTLLGLITGAAVSLLVLALMPHPVPNLHSQALGHRRIHQEDNDYTAPKQTGSVLPAESEPASLKRPFENSWEATRLELAVLELGKEAGGYNIPQLPQPNLSSKENEKQEEDDTGVGQVEEVIRKERLKGDPGSQSPSNNTVLQTNPLAEIVDVPRTKTKESELQVKAQETALTALQHGFKLTEGQKKLIEKMTPDERKSLESRVTKVRIMQEKAYLRQLRSKNQVRQLKNGGEEVISTPQMPVRFPATLQKVHPRDWLPQYKLFLNLTHYPWAKSPSCSNFSITFQPPDSLPTRGLASFPSSGNTWIRYLVETATGMYTGSFYDDTSLIKKGMYGEGIVYNSGMTILQKSHGYTTGDAMKLSHAERLTKNHMTELGCQSVLVIRNPFKALISHRHLDIGGHTGYAPKAQFIGKGWAEFVTLKIMLWKEFYIDWLTQCQPSGIHITHYEDVKRDVLKEMERILTYLKLKHDAKRLQCVGQHTDGLFKRKPSKNVPLDNNPFTQELKNLVYEAIDELNSALKRSGKLPLPLDLYEFYDSHEAEVARYIRRRRKDVS